MGFMLTCGLAADILFYSFSEWVMYADNQHIKELGFMQEWVGVFPLFHWSFIPWAFSVGGCVWIHAACKKKKTSAVF